jgi:hypothetical protein
MDRLQPLMFLWRAMADRTNLEYIMQLTLFVTTE